jgi:hypothetical protein
MIASTQAGVKMPRGGKRPGAGRKPEGEAPKTKQVRILPEYGDKVDDLIALHRATVRWSQAAAGASSTSPRWAKMRQFLAEVQTYL